MSRLSHLTTIGVLVSAALWFSVNAQSISITGSVVDDGSSAGIANAKVSLLEIPSCTTRTDANGEFTLGGTTATLPQVTAQVSACKINLSGNRLLIAAIVRPAEIVVDVYNILGKQISHAEKFAASTAEFTSLWNTPGLYYVKVRIGNEQRILSNSGSNQSATVQLRSNNVPKSLAKTSAVYTIEAGKSGYDSKQVSMTTIIGSAGVIRLSTCSQAPGTWKDVSPNADVKTGYGGVLTVVVDPVRPSDCWFAASVKGIWKSTDYGLTWKKANTGTNGSWIDGGRPHYFSIDLNPNRDPATAPTLYVQLLYGLGGIWKSTDGGVSWHNTWNNQDGYAMGTKNIYAPDGTTLISDDVGTDIGGFMMVDSSGPNHLIAFLHSYYGTGNNNGIFETTDGGVKWIVNLNGREHFNFQTHSDVALVIDHLTRLVVHNTCWPCSEVWRSTDAGGSWTLSTGQLTPSAGAGTGNPLLVVNGSTVYIPGSQYSGLFKSTNKGALWSTIVNDWVGWVVASASKFYIFSAPARFSTGTLRWAPRTNDRQWTTVPGATNAGGYISDAKVTFDGTHYIILGAQSNDGMYRYVEP